MKNLYEFAYIEFGEDFESLQDVVEYVNYLVIEIQASPIHYGDCIKQNVSCHLCYLTTLLERYYNYTKYEFTNSIKSESFPK